MLVQPVEALEVSVSVISLQDVSSFVDGRAIENLPLIGTSSCSCFAEDCASTAALVGGSIEEAELKLIAASPSRMAMIWKNEFEFGK